MKNSMLRGRLFRKYIVVLLVLVGGVLMASSLVELYFSYRETQRAILRVERARAVAAAASIERFLREVELQVRETTRTASDDPDASQVGPGRLGFREGLGAALAEQRELDFLRVLRNVPAIAELSHLDLSGKEQLRVSRLDPDVVGSQEDFSRAPKFVEARAGKTYWSPVYFKNDSEPYVTLAVPGGKYAVEVTTAEVSLGAVLKTVSQIEVGPGGYAYVVDSRDQLVAHPDSRVLRAKRDLSALAQVKSARADRSGSAGDGPGRRRRRRPRGRAGPRGARGDRAPRVAGVRRTAGRRRLRAPPGPDHPERRHLRAGPRALHPGEHPPRPADGRADPGAPGGRGANRRRRPRPSHRGPDRRRARGARRRAEPDGGPARGVLREPRGEGRGAHARAGGRRTRA